MSEISWYVQRMSAAWGILALLLIIFYFAAPFVLLLIRGSLPGTVGRVAYLAAVALYALIAVIAAVPRLVTDIGLTAPALQAEAVLLTILVFAGVNVAWLLLFEEPQPSAPHRAGQ